MMGRVACACGFWKFLFGQFVRDLGVCNSEVVILGISFLGGCNHAKGGRTLGILPLFFRLSSLWGARLFCRYVLCGNRRALLG